MGSGSTRFSQVLIFAFLRAVLGRSIVIHEADSGAGRIDCATIEYPEGTKSSIGVVETGGTFDM